MKYLLIAILVALPTLFPIPVFSESSSKPPEGMVLIPAGQFIFGADPSSNLSSFMSDTTSSQNASPSQTGNLPSFYLDKYEVTYGDFIRFKPKAKYPDGRVDHPIRGVSWYEAEAYCFWLNKRLPTELEWEKAARGSEGFVFVWGNEFNKEKANFGKAVKRVGSFPEDKSVFGIFDLNGNVSEWTASVYEPYPGSTYKDPNFGKKLRVVRGGAYNKREHGFLQVFATLSFRNPVPPTMRSWDTGFRCALSK